MTTDSGAGNIRNRGIEDEMRSSYLDYAMSVIVQRALPDVRDGLKPVQRRILFSMHEMGLRPNAAYRKSAAIVGEVMGKYHPHGDAPVYQSSGSVTNTSSTSPQHLDTGVNARRARMGFLGTFQGDWQTALILDLGGSSDGFAHAETSVITSASSSM